MPYIVSDKIRPCNETRFTLYPVRRVFKSLKEQAADFLGVCTDEVVSLSKPPESASPNLTFVPNSKPGAEGKRFHSHKRTAFGRFACARIYDAAGAMDREANSVSDYLFLTATLPGDTEEAKWGIAEYAHEIINGLKAWLSKRMLNRKEFYVWENQKRGALHFHYCIYCPNRDIQSEITRSFKREIVRLYDGIKEKHGCDLWGKWTDKPTRYRVAILQARVEVVYKSVGAYMASYLGGKSDKHSEDANHRYYPKRWFGVSRPLSESIKKHTSEIKHEFTSYSDAREFLERCYEDSVDDSLTHQKFPHKIGEGITASLFHTQEKQQELWQLRSMLKHTPRNHPHIAHYIASSLKSTLELQGAFRKSKSLQERLPSELASALMDSMFTTSLRHGVLKRESMLVLEKMFSLFDFSSSSCRVTQSCFHSLLTFNLMTAHYFPQMRFNQWGILSNDRDFTPWVDKRQQARYVGTNTETVHTPLALDGSSGHVPDLLGASLFEQLSVL